jgi:AmmeMemoRadiSam system protein A
MAPMSLSDAQGRQLLRLAKASVVQGLHSGKPLVVTLADYDADLRQPAASFVTLERYKQLRGCIGRLEAVRPLVLDVVDNAFSAAFKDPRFSPLMASELAGLSLHLSVLSSADALEFSSEAELLAQLRPGVDGLIVQVDSHRATFLPSVWSQLPKPSQFLNQLKRKAGLAADYWSPMLKAWRYTTQSFQ